MGKSQRIIICRLCLRKCIDFKAVEAYVKDVLDILLLKINLTVSKKPVMCTNCAEMLMRYFEFKATCFYTHDYIVPFLDDKKISKLDLRILYMSKYENVNIPDDHGACGLCMEITKKCTAITLNNDEKDVLLENFIEKCLPELDLSTIEEPIICAACYESLKTCYHFVTSCLIVEEKIMNYRKYMDADIIEIADVLQLTSGNVSIVEDGTAIDVITAEGKFCVDTRNTDVHKNGSFIHMGEQTLSLNQDVEINADPHDLDRCLDSVVSPQPITTKLHGRKKCLMAKESTLKPSSKHKKVYNISGAKLYQCDLCLYCTNNVSNLKTHHRRIHSNPKEMKMHRCDCCLYQTKYKKLLDDHTLKHHNSSEVPIRQTKSPSYGCKTCSFQTKHKASFHKHMITHREISDTTMYQCFSCSFKTKRKYNLHGHMLTHKAPTKVTTYQCKSCPRQTKQKSHLKLCDACSYHSNIYQCDICSFHSKHRCSLQRHMLTHKHPSEVTIYQCDTCSYHSNDKANLRRHMLTHKHPSEKPFYQCEHCSFLSNWKANIRRHISQTHLRRNNVRM